MPKENIHLNKQKEKNPDGLSNVKSEVRELTHNLNMKNFSENKEPLPSFERGKDAPDKMLAKDRKSPLE